MCRNVSFLVLFALVLTVVNLTWADDVNPPEFAGAPGWGAGLWEFDLEPPEPTDFAYNPKLEEAEFFVDGVVEGWWIEGEGILEPDGEGRFYMTMPEGDGDTMTMNIQMTWEGDGDVWAFPEVWTGPDDEGGDYLGGNEGIDPEIIELDNGMMHGTWYGSVGDVGELAVALIGGEGVTIHQLVVDAVLHSDDEPEGTGQRPGGPAEPELARDPEPADAADDVVLDIELSWTPGDYAQTHNVYFGTDAEEVNDADTTSALLVSQGQTGAGYTPRDLLAFGRTYCWRVDEINAPPDNTVFRGHVWSFTAEPVGYPIETITATASSSHAENMGPEKTIDGSGINELDQHSVNGWDMWLSSAGDPNVWIQYEFDKAYKLHELWIWNSNQIVESIMGLGIKDVIIETSLDGTDWVRVESVPQIKQATGTMDYEHSTAIDLAGAVARQVRITMNSAWGTLAQFSISECRFFFIPTYAREPEPTSDVEESVGPDTMLEWRAGREAASHLIYLSTDEDSVLAGTAPVVSVAEPSFAPDGLLLGQTYFWRVDEVNEATVPPSLTGDIWSFATSESVVVDDFEDYGDDNVNFEAIFQTWIDGLGYNEPVERQGNNTGSIVGYAQAPFAEQDTVHDDSGQSMPLEYDNSQQPYYSETERSFDEAQDWTRAGIKALTLNLYGDPENMTSDQLYVTLKDSQGHAASVAYDGDAQHMAESLWHEWNIDLQAFSGVDLSQVAGICLGVGDRDDPQAGAAGMVFIDNILLHPTRCVAAQAPAGDVNGDCVVDDEDIAALTNDWLKTYATVEYTFDSGLADSSGNDRNGIGRNSPTVANGALSLDGSNFVDIPLGADNPFDGTQDFTIALDFKADMPSILFSSARDAEPDNHAMSIFIHHWNEPSWGEVIYDNFHIGGSTAEDNPLDGEWHTVVVTYTAEDEWVTVYLDGLPGEGAQMNPEIPDIAADTARIGGSLNEEYPYNEDVANLDGDIDNVRIFSFALSAADIYRLPALPTGPADLNGDGIVNQADRDTVDANMGAETLWP